MHLVGAVLFFLVMESEELDCFSSGESSSDSEEALYEEEIDEDGVKETFLVPAKSNVSCLHRTNYTKYYTF